MAKIRNPKRFSDQLGVSSDKFARLGVLDPTLNVDTRLFIDPLPLAKSRHTEITPIEGRPRGETITVQINKTGWLEFYLFAGENWQREV